MGVLARFAQPFKLIASVIGKLFGIFIIIVDSLPFGTILLDFTTSFASSAFRLFAGGWITQGIESAPRPTKPLVLYEFEACLFCRKVREHLSELDLDVIIYPTPKEYEGAPQGYSGTASRFRPVAKKQGGKAQFPYLVDANKDTQLYESDAIIAYLWENYGPPLNKRGRKPLIYFLPAFISMPLNLFSFLFRFFRKNSVYRTHSKYDANMQLIHLWTHEASPNGRLVRETLNTLELPHLLHYTPHGSQKRTELSRLNNNRKIPLVPYLEDPNTGWKGFGAVKINTYLRKEYQTGGIAQEGDNQPSELKKEK